MLLFPEALMGDSGVNANDEGVCISICMYVYTERVLEYCLVMVRFLGYVKRK